MVVSADARSATSISNAIHLVLDIALVLATRRLPFATIHVRLEDTGTTVHCFVRKHAREQITPARDQRGSVQSDAMLDILATTV